MPDSSAYPSAGYIPESGTATTTSACCGMLPSQPAAESLPRGRDAPAEHLRVRPGEVDVLEDAGRRDREREPVRGEAVAREAHDLPRLDVALEFGPDEVEGAGLRGDDRRPLADAEREGADPVRIAHGENPLTGEDDERVRPADVGQRLGDRGREGRGLRTGHEVEDHLGVRGRREEGPARLEGGPDLPGVHEVAVMRQGEGTPPGVEDDRLGVQEQRGARRRVPDVADGRPAREAGEPRAVEDVGDVAHLALDVDLAAVERGDPGRLLAAVLEGVEAEVREIGGVVRVADAEDTALIREPAPVGHWKMSLTSGEAGFFPTALRPRSAGDDAPPFPAQRRPSTRNSSSSMRTNE